MVHGGAGALDNIKSEKGAVRYLESIRSVLEHGRRILESGGSALETVEQCAIGDSKAIKEMNDSGCTALTWKESDIDSLRKTAYEVGDEWAEKSPLAHKVIEAQKSWLRELGRIP